MYLRLEWGLDLKLEMETELKLENMQLGLELELKLEMEMELEYVKVDAGVYARSISNCSDVCSVSCSKSSSLKRTLLEITSLPSVSSHSLLLFMNVG